MFGLFCGFSDLQMRPYRTDDFITKLYYETSRFSAFNLQWVVKAHVNDNQKNPSLTLKRSLTYQLVCILAFIMEKANLNLVRVHYLYIPLCFPPLLHRD